MNYLGRDWGAAVSKWSAMGAAVSAPLLKIDVPSVVFPKVPWVTIPETTRQFVRIPLLERLGRVKDAFAAAGLVPAPSMEPGLVEEVVEAHEDGASPEELSRLVLDCYDADGAAKLASVVEGLCESPHFAGRETTLRQTLEAHRLGLDAVTVFPLVPMIEGVLEPYLRALTDEQNQMSGKQVARALKEMPVYGVGFAGTSRLVGFLEARLYERWRPGDDSGTVEGYAEINRHRLAHGYLKEGTRVDALRCFLALETIGALLAAWDELLREEEEEDGSEGGEGEADGRT